MKVYLNDEKKSVDPWLLYDILRGLKALCDILLYNSLPEKASATEDLTFYNYFFHRTALKF